MASSVPIATNPRLRLLGAGPQISEAARPSYQRLSHNGFDRDHSRLVSYQDRRVLLSTSRWLYANIPAVEAAVNEQAEIVAGNLAVQFDGEDKAWGDAAEAWLGEHDRIADIRGAPFSMQLIDHFVVVQSLRDGDFFIHLTSVGDEYPQLQSIPAHRVRGDFAKAPKANDGPPEYADAFVDYTVRDGVVCNDWGRALAYMVWDDVQTSWRYIPAQDMVPCFCPRHADQLRGVPAMASSIIHWQDREEFLKFELQGMKLAASIALIESNETGGPPTEAGQLVAATNDPDTGALLPATYGQQMLGGEVRYFAGKSGGKLEALVSDRPTQNQREFVRDVARDALAAMGWSIDFSLDPSRVGGAPHRSVVERINRTVKFRRDNLLFPVRRRIDGWRIAKAIKLGFLPPNDQWHSWRYTGAADLTADARYSYDVAAGEISKGLTSVQRECARRGVEWEDMQDEQIEAERRLLEKCAIAKVNPDHVRQFASNSTQTFQPDANPAPAA